MSQKPCTGSFLQIRLLSSRGLGQDRAAFTLPSLQLPPPALSTSAASAVSREQVSSALARAKRGEGTHVASCAEVEGASGKYVGAFKVPAGGRHLRSSQRWFLLS